MQLGYDISLSTPSTWGGLSAAIAALFAAGEQGAWYEPSDFTTLFQDSAGTTPVTAVEQPVGLMLDKRLGLVLGAELVTNGTFDTDTGWTTTPVEITISSGKLNFVATTGLTQNNATTYVSGVTYKVVFTISGRSAGAVNAQLSNGGIAPAVTSAACSADGTYTFYLQSNGNTTFRFLTTGGATTLSIDNVSVKAVNGNHATQATAAARPTLSARVNLLTKTEDFADAVWVAFGTTTKTANFATAPDGTTTACRVTFSTAASDQLYQNAGIASNSTWGVWVKSNTGGNQSFRLKTNGPDVYSANLTATTTWQFFTHTGLASAAGSQAIGNSSLATTSDILIWHPQLETGTVATNYQRVNTATDYDSVGFKKYLVFDGVDDSMATASINFTATDKMMVVAGVRKNSDDAFIAELSANSGVNAGSFYVYNGTDAGGTGYTSLSRGDATAASGQASKSFTFVGLDTAVLAVTHDIVGDLSTMRRNKIAGTSGVADKGLGNFGNYPLYIGARAGTSIFFNGRIYSMIIRGAASSAAQITSAETYANSKTGAF